MTTNLLHDVGVALYGPRWQTDLAHFLSVSDRTMRRWAADPSLVPIGVWPQLLLALELHAASIEKVQTKVRDKVASIRMI